MDSFLGAPDLPQPVSTSTASTDFQSKTPRRRRRSCPKLLLAIFVGFFSLVYIAGVVSSQRKFIEVYTVTAGAGGISPRIRTPLHQNTIRGVQTAPPEKPHHGSQGRSPTSKKGNGRTIMKEKNPARVHIATIKAAQNDIRVDGIDGDGGSDDQSEDNEEESDQENSIPLMNDHASHAISNDTNRPWLAIERPSVSIHNRTVVPFEKQPGVVIASKIHGPHQLSLLEQSLCLLHYAYNKRPLYDIVIFTTMEVSDEQAQPLRDIVYPSNLTFVLDNRGLQQEIAALAPRRRENFLKACSASDMKNLTWWSDCGGRIAYNWQAEFRAWHIWRNPALDAYKWMMWLDADGFCTQEWEIDPIQAMIENDLVILFDNWPKGVHKGKDVQDRIWEAFGVNVCQVRIKKGHFVTKLSNNTPGAGGCKRGRVADIHGFFHITNLDFYRKEAVQKWGQTWIGDGFLQRRYDDQAGVTVPAAILDPDRAWDMRRNHIRLNVYHNFDLDGKKFERVGGFLKYWKNVARHQFPEAAKVCKITNRA